MTSIVPYKRLAVAGLNYGLNYRPMKRARLAYQVGKYAYQNRSKIFKAARVIKRAWRSYRSKNKRMARQIGERPGKSNSSRNEQVQQNTSFSSRTLHSDECILLNRNTTSSQEINQRERHTVVVKGIKFCIKVRNFESYPLWCNVAIIHPKSELGVGNDVPNDEFFRAFSTSRVQDFGISLSGMDLHCFPINTDKYVVLRHKRFTLGSAAAFATGGTWPPFKLLDFYVKLNRQIRFKGDSATDLEEGQVYCAFWCDSPDTGTSAAAVADSMQVSRRYITYFKNPR